MSHTAPKTPPVIPLKADPARRSAARARRASIMDDHKRSFLRMVSHELRTPLNAIIGFSEILHCELYGPLGAPQYKEYAGMVRESGLKLLKLVNQILEIARLDGHVTDLDLCAEDLDHALDDVRDTLRDELATRHTQLSIEAEGALPPVLADARGLRTILVNLIQNASVYSPEGSQVRVSARRVGPRVEIEVSNDGEGVEASELARLVRPFEQGESALTRSSHGAGLGLPIVSLLAQAMGGSLRLRSTPGEGFTATVLLTAAG
jgi:signal transduction histidine kinase